MLKDATPVQRAVRGRPARVHRRRRRSSACAPASCGSATASSACSTCTRCCSRRTKGVGFQPWLRGSIDGITADADARASCRSATASAAGSPPTSSCMRGSSSATRAAARRSSARCASSGAERAADPRQRAQDAQARRPARVEPAAGHLGRLRRATTPTTTRTRSARTRSCARSRRRSRGSSSGTSAANNGRHARIAAEGARHVVAIDADQGPVELLYRELRDAGDETILPLTMNLADPSPGLGWRGRERKPLLDRGRPDLVLALALVHHLVDRRQRAGRGVRRLARRARRARSWSSSRRARTRWCRGCSPRKREGLHPDYDRATFERCLRRGVRRPPHRGARAPAPASSTSRRRERASSTDTGSRRSG